MYGRLKFLEWVVVKTWLAEIRGMWWQFLACSGSGSNVFK